MNHYKYLDKRETVFSRRRSVGHEKTTVQWEFMRHRLEEDRPQWHFYKCPTVE